MSNTFIGSQTGGADFLSQLTVRIGQSLGHEMKPLDTTTMDDKSGSVHRMFIFDAHEQRIYRVQNGQRHFIDIDIPNDGHFDIDDVTNQIRSAILKLEMPIEMTDATHPFSP